MIIANMTQPLIKKITAHYQNHDSTLCMSFGIFGVVTYPFFYLIWIFADARGYENFLMRMIATLLCLGLVFKDKWPKKLSPLLPFYWYLTLFYCLPFLFTFLLLKNDFSDVWITNTMTVLVLSILLMDLITLSILLPIGIITGIALAVLTGGQFQLPPTAVSILISYLSIIIFGALFARRKDILQTEKLQAMRSLGASIAHELRTPLRTISLGITGIKKYLPDLLTTYHLARENGVQVPYISRMHHDSLFTACEDIESEVRSAFTVIDMLLANVNPTKISSTAFANYSIKDCVNEALQRYPFDKQEAALVNFQPQGDFIFQGDKLSIIHVIFNLLKNALYHIRASGKKESRIFITLKSDNKANHLYFRDEGTGISSKYLPYIFNHFSSKTLHGTGAGLPFCKLVMEAIKGSITCSSEEGKYTEFQLTFPTVPSNEREAHMPLPELETMR